MPFSVSPSVMGDEGGVTVYVIPACVHPLPESPNTALLLLDTPGLLTPNG